MYVEICRIFRTQTENKEYTQVITEIRTLIIPKTKTNTKNVTTTEIS